jgi:hypothetical protein
MNVRHAEWSYVQPYVFSYSTDQEYKCVIKTLYASLCIYSTGYIRASPSANTNGCMDASLHAYNTGSYNSVLVAIVLSV